jgi:hypothetical protein
LHPGKILSLETCHQLSSKALIKRRGQDSEQKEKTLIEEKKPDFAVD